MCSALSPERRRENARLGAVSHRRAVALTRRSCLRPCGPDWEQAARFYREACRLYGLSDEWATCVQVLRESALVHDEIRGYYQAGKDLSAAGVLLRDALADARGAQECFQEAALCYRKQGSFASAVAAYSKAADCATRADAAGDAALELLSEACAVHEQEPAAAPNFAPAFHAAVRLALQRRQYATARAFLERESALCRQQPRAYERDLHRNGLAVVVLLCTEGARAAAARRLDELARVEGFAASACGRAAARLLEALEAADREALALSCFKYLHADVARLARALQPAAAEREEADGATDFV